MKCNHDINNLIGTADGILCRKCGKLFSSFDEIKANIDPDHEETATAQAPAEKPKRTRKKKEA